jgi:hypothetical protein
MGGGAVSTEAILQGRDGTPLRCNRSENIFAADGMDVCVGGQGLGVMKRVCASSGSIYVQSGWQARY